MQKQKDLPKAFEKLGVDVPVLMALRKMGFTEPSDIQTALIPPILEGKDILGQAQTGTGKTAAFGIPVLQQLDKGGRLQALCLAPTRELAVQVTAELQRLAEFTGLHCVPVYGGQKIAAQAAKLGRKPHFVIGTPGRVKDLIGRGMLDLSDIRYVVLDEVDRMLDIGFRDDIRDILSRIKGDHQSVFVSATVEDDIRKLAGKHSKNLQEINVSRDNITAEHVDQYYVTAERQDKFRLLKTVLEVEKPESAIVFTNTKAAARRLAKRLDGMGINALEIHGDLMQRKRDAVMQRFRKNRVTVLVATDLAARGLDVRHVTHIINFDLPKDPEVYVHRIGRTARMGAEGFAVSFVTREEGKELTLIEKLINREVPEKTYDGFKASPPEDARPADQKKKDEEASPQATVSSRLMWPAENPGGNVRRTIGGKFKPTRRRR